MEIRSLKTIAVGSTSAIALLASATHSMAEGLYMGLALGFNSGENPSPGSSSNEDYEMAGQSVSGFIGITHDMANDMFGGVELAYTGPTEGDKNEDSSYEYAYDTNYTIDAKLRVGKHMGQMDLYGFAGLSTGSVNGCCYGNDYSFTGYNLGAGAQFNLSEKMFGGIEYIHRFTDGTEDGDDGYSASHGTVSLRIGYNF